MKIAVATDQDFIASGFGCASFCTMVDIEDGRIRDTLLTPDPGSRHAFWPDLFSRNSIRFIVAGPVGSTGRSLKRGQRIQPVLGVGGQIDDVVRRFSAEELRVERPTAEDAAHAGACCECKS